MRSVTSWFKKPFLFMLGISLVWVYACTTGAWAVPLNPADILLSNEGVPNVPDSNGNKGFLPNNTNSAPNPSFVDCAGGSMGPSAGRGYNCLIQVDQDDATGYILGVFYKAGTNNAFPVFRIAREGQSIFDSVNIQPNIIESGVYWNPYRFSDPTHMYQENCTLCITNNSNAGIHGADTIAGIYGVPVNKFPTVMPLLTLFGQTQTNDSIGLQWGLPVLKIGDEGHQHIGGAYAGGLLEVSSCGAGSPSIAGADGAFVVTVDMGSPTACTVTFHAMWTSTDITCNFISETDFVSWKFSKVGSANAWTGITFRSSGPLTSGSKIHGICVGHV